jgi:hypothetical protein
MTPDSELSSDVLLGRLRTLEELDLAAFGEGAEEADRPALETSIEQNRQELVALFDGDPDAFETALEELPHPDQTVLLSNITQIYRLQRPNFTEGGARFIGMIKRRVRRARKELAASGDGPP